MAMELGLAISNWAAAWFKDRLWRFMVLSTVSLNALE